MRTLNLGILAHVDAGKTTLTERLLYAAGVIDEVGSVDDGNTQTDTLALERQRGITIKAAVVSFAIGDVTVNLIDTPGHPDFIAEVERVLGVLDGVVLVLSAVEGVQSQTRVLMRTLQRLRIPTLLFVNKIDRTGADPSRVLEHIAQKLTPAIVPMGTVSDAGTRHASFRPYSERDGEFAATLADVLARHDERILATYVDDENALPYPRLRRALAKQARRALVHPVFFGSAITGAGVDELMSGIREFLPAPESGADGPGAGTVFKVERGPAGDKIAYVRVFSGTLHVRERVRFGQGHEGRITAINVFEDGRVAPRARVSAGRIAKVAGLADVRVGDAIGTSLGTSGRHAFAPPTLETVVVPVRASKGALHAALMQLAEQDPLINLRQDDIHQELFVSLYGEVQKEVIQATLEQEFGLAVEFRETTTICVERPIGAGEAVERIKENPFLATIGLRVEPGAVNSGAEFRVGHDVLGTMPAAFYRAIEDTVHETLRQGLYGWQVTDCLVTLTHTGYYPRQSHAHQGFSKSMSSTGADFRGLTPLVLMAALSQAGTCVFEPVHRFRIEVPADTLDATVSVLMGLQAIPAAQEMHGASSVLEGEIPAAHVHALQRMVPALTRGEGVLECTFDSYQPVRGAAIPTRPRSDHNPLNRKEYLLHVLRRV